MSSTSWPSSTSTLAPPPPPRRCGWGSSDRGRPQPSPAHRQSHPHPLPVRLLGEMRELPDGFAPRRSQNGVQWESREDHHRVVSAPKRWEHAMADQSSNVLTDLADRRSALRVLGAASTAFLAALGLGGATGETRGEDKGKTDSNQRAKRTRHMEDANQSADR